MRKAHNPGAVGLAVLFVLLNLGDAQVASAADLHPPELILTDVPFDVSVSGVAPSGAYALQVGDTFYDPTASDAAGEDTLRFNRVVATRSGTATLTLMRDNAAVAVAEVPTLWAPLSVLPPLFAIAMALVFRSVVPALFGGAWLGAYLLADAPVYGVLASLLRVFETYVVGAVANPDHVAILLFTFMIGGLMGIVSRNGGMLGMVQRLTGWAHTPNRGQLITTGLGTAIFFDDYANTMVVGHSMRPVTDRLRISREKLAFLVDATAAPIACVAVVTSWVGYEVGLIGEVMAQIGLTEGAYLVYLKSIAYSFYPLLMLLFVFLIAGTGRDFGTMRTAEVRARTTGALTRPEATVADRGAEGRAIEPDQTTPARPINAILPIGVLIVGVIVGLFVTGEGDSFQAIIGSANAYQALMWASLVAVLTATVLTLGQRLLSLEETVQAWFSGVKLMLFGVIILVLAWTLADIVSELQATSFLVSLFGDNLAPGAIPASIFVLAALVAFGTGSSWGAMAILMPLVIPLTWAILVANNMVGPEDSHILYSAIACVLCGAVWGDHCSPISDTTVLSSMASGCDHIDHVRTQLPYAILVGIVSLVACTVPAAYGVPWWLVLGVGAALVVAAVFVVGKPTGEAEHAVGE